ncbi:HlyD family secretion protein [Haloferula rosea]|uniref:HlyD family secretion protein n=1 Tax=Haloferula rosea TaxID=490093 RepID=A0A934VCX4_9BACT|nr:HlyD family secretion protein [Haloferula rosea]MBK1828903.1 HlyD family secretion protein [Haloferula rosea]
MSEEKNDADAAQEPKAKTQPAEPTAEAPDGTKVKKKADAATRWTRRVLVVCIVAFIWYLIGDRYTPYTGQARVRGYVVPIVPQVSGEVIEVAVGLNSPVKAGEVLAKILSKDYELAVRNAEASLERAGQDMGASTADVGSATAAVAEARAALDLSKSQLVRIEKAFESAAVSEADLDKARSNVDLSKAQLENAEQALEQAKQNLGQEGEENPRLVAAQAALEDAQLDLQRTVLRAPRDGGVTNVRIEKGQYANVGQPLMTFIGSDEAWIEAYMRENSIGRVKPGDTVDIVLDVKPGRIFKGTVQSTGYGVDWGDVDNAGVLPKIKGSKDWLRDPQRFPVVISFDKEEARGLLREGGQADVVIYTSDNVILNAVGGLWIRLVSWFSYVQ